MKKRKYTFLLISVLLISLIVTNSQSYANSNQVAISGASVLTSKQMGDFVLLTNPEPKLNEIDIYRLAELFLSIGRVEGIRGDIAFAQSILETGFFEYGNDVFPEQNNFSGIGAVGGGAQGAYFNTPEEGVRAQIQHLKAYANHEPLVTEKIDPRFDLVKRGIAPNWTDLNNRWAVPGHNYGERILDIFKQMKSIDLSIPNIPIGASNDLPVAALYLKSDQPLISPDGKVSKVLKKGFSYKIFGTLGNNYNLGGNYIVAANSSKMNVYVGRLFIKDSSAVLKKPDGTFHRTLSPGENIRVYSLDNQAYYVGGGYFIEKSPSLSFYRGTVKVNEDTPLINRNHEVVRILKKNEQFRVYSISGNTLDLGGGLFITYDKRKHNYMNH